MTQRNKRTESDFGEIEVAILSCDLCNLEVAIGNQDGWTQTQTFGNIGSGISIWEQPKHFCTVAHLIDFYQAATPDQ